MKRTIKIALVGLGIFGCASMASAKEHLYSVDASGIDPNVSAKEDFYQHVNDGWMKNHPLTPEYARYGAFNILNDSSNNRIRGIIMGLAATNPERGSLPFKVSTLYEAGMDSVRRNALGIAPLMPIINKVENATPAEMEDIFLLMQKEYSNPFLNVGFQPDLANSNEYTMYIEGMSLGLGDRDYYLLDEPRQLEVRNAYRQLLVDYMTLAGYSQAEAERIADNVIKIETAQAEYSMTKEEKRDLSRMNNPYTLEQVKAEFGAFPWDRFFIETMGFETPENFIVTDIKGTANAANLFANTTDREKKDYYISKLIRYAAPYLSDDFSDANFRFNQVMSGVQQQQPRWKRSLGTVEGLMGEAVGELYVEKYFPQSSKDYMIGLVENLRTALGKHINNLSWMSDETKEQALKKLNAIDVKIGYPDKWKDYTSMEIDPSLSYYDNVHNAQLWNVKEELAKWGKPVDRTEWQMTPQTINAYYNPLGNEIVFPAGILQAPFFDPRSSDAENYGGIGVVIGHEMTHGFDDQGRLFDANGNMQNWWTEADAEAFTALTQALVAQFDEVEVLPGLHANGQYTLGENIADHGGLRIAMTAFLESQKQKGVDITSEEALIDGFDPIQVFYMNYANLWAQNVREEEIRNLTVQDVHSLGKNRVNVSLKNITPFFEAFGIEEGDPMYRPVEERLIIW